MNTPKIAKLTCLSRALETPQTASLHDEKLVNLQRASHPVVSFPPGVKSPSPLGAFPSFAVAVIAALALGGCADLVPSGDRGAFSKAIQTSDKLIVPGDRIGPIRLGMSKDDVVRLLGTPEKVRKYLPGANWADEGYECIYDNGNFHVGFPAGPAPTVKEIKVWDPQFVTEKGVRSGDPTSDVLQKHGAPTDAMGYLLWYEYDDRRLVFHLTHDQRVGSISVWRPHN